MESRVIRGGGENSRTGRKGRVGNNLAVIWANPSSLYCSKHYEKDHFGMDQLCVLLLTAHVPVVWRTSYKARSINDDMFLSFIFVFFYVVGGTMIHSLCCGQDL
jgi:hypothetical protein